MDSPDFIPDDKFTPDQPVQQTGASESPEFIPDDKFTSDEDKYGTTGQQLTTAAEHAASSATFGLSTKAETALGVNPEDIRARTEENPISAGVGEIGGLLIPGAPEAKLLGKAGEIGSGIVRGSGVLSRVGKAAVKGAIENAMFQGGDEVSKSFANDPNQSAQTAISNIGLSALLGGAISGVGGAISGVAFGLLPELSDKFGATKFVSDFSDRIKEHLTNPDLQTEGDLQTEAADRLANRLANFHADTSAGSDSLFRGQYDEARNRLPSTKDQAIDNLIPQMNDKIMDEGIGKITNKIEDKLEEMKADKDTYQPKFTKSLESDYNKWKTVIDSPDVTSQQVFHATEDLKRILQERSKIGIPIDNSNPAFDSIKSMKKLASDLRKSLEDESVWGEAGKFQKETNQAYSQFLDPLKDFNRSFGAKVGGEYKVDPDKVQSYINQVDKDKGTIRGEKLDNYIQAANKYRDAINEAHEKIGIAGPYSPEAKEGLNILSHKLPQGARAADTLVKNLVEKSGGNISGVAGGVIGGWPGAIAGKIVGGPILDSVLPNLIKPVLGSAADGTGFRAALDYVGAFSKGESSLNKGIKNLFKAGKEALPANIMVNERDRTKLDNNLKTLAQNPESMTNVGGNTSHYLPEHGQALAQTSMAAVNYLNSVRPQSPKVSPLDSPSKIDPMQKQNWDRTLDIAEQPLTILDKIKQGTLQPTDLKNIQALYPSLYQKISQGIVSEISSRTDKSDPISYRTKMGMSLFLSQPMDSTMQSQSIVAAQPKPQQPQQSSQQSGKKPTAESAKSMNKVSQSAMTPEQNRVAQRSGVEKA
jgi:hypothetical protein